MGMEMDKMMKTRKKNQTQSQWTNNIQSKETIL